MVTLHCWLKCTWNHLGDTSLCIFECVCTPSWRGRLALNVDSTIIMDKLLNWRKMNWVPAFLFLQPLILLGQNSWFQSRECFCQKVQQSHWIRSSDFLGHFGLVVVLHNFTVSKDEWSRPPKVKSNCFSSMEVRKMCLEGRRSFKAPLGVSMPYD